MDRLTFFNSISGIDYPEMLVKFYDQLLALKDLVPAYDAISVISSNDNSITFSVISKYNQQTVSIISTYSGRFNVYGKLIPVNIDNLTDTEIILTFLK